MLSTDMSKITFRADDELVDAVEDLDASKSEVMREALRAYLGIGPASGPEAFGHVPLEESLEDVVARRVDERLDERLGGDGEDPDVTVYVEFDGANPEDVTVDHARTAGVRERGTAESTTYTRARDAPAQTVGHQTCAQCGVDLDPNHVYCPNCGEHAARSFYCECGADLRSDWSFCPTCGRRTASAEYLEP